MKSIVFSWVVMSTFVNATGLMPMWIDKVLFLEDSLWSFFALYSKIVIRNFFVFIMSILSVSVTFSSNFTRNAIKVLFLQIDLKIIYLKIYSNLARGGGGGGAIESYYWCWCLMGNSQCRVMLMVPICCDRDNLFGRIWSDFRHFIWKISISVGTVRCRHNAISCLKSRHPILASPLGWDVGCLFCIQILIYILLQSLQRCIW